MTAAEWDQRRKQKKKDKISQMRQQALFINQALPPTQPSQMQHNGGEVVGSANINNQNAIESQAPTTSAAKKNKILIVSPTNRSNGTSSAMVA